MLRTALIFIVGLVFIAAIIGLPFHPVLKVVAGAGLMYAASKLLGKELKITDDFGLLMIRSRVGLGSLEKAAKADKFWNAAMDLGTVIGYGLLSFFILKRPIKEKLGIMAAGFLLMGFIAFFVAPSVFPFMLETLGTSNLASTSKSVSGAVGLLPFILAIGGFAFMGLSSLMFYTWVIISSVGSALSGNGALSSIVPGATLVLPGVNIPFVEGILALAVILVVHEGAHAVMTRVAKVRLLSTGVVLFGVMPIGAFVEPDEKRLLALDAQKQTRMLVAGSSANFFASVFFFLLLAIFMVSTGPFKESSLFVSSGLMNGTTVHKINGADPLIFLKSTEKDVLLDSELTFTTNAGEYTTRIGEGITYKELFSSYLLIGYANPVMKFIYNLLGLAFALNFVVGTVNLLPLPFFDGYRVAEVNVPNKRVVAALSMATALAFLINFVPWLF